MPGKVGDAQRILHDQKGQTPINEYIVLNTAGEERMNRETVEDETLEVKRLLERI